MITPQQFLTSIIWGALIRLNAIKLLELFGCGALHGLFDYLLHICQESVILQLIKPPEFFMVRQNGSFIPTFMCQSHKPWRPHLLIYLHPGLIFRLSLTKLGTLTLVPNMLFLLTRGNTISTLFLHSISLIGGRRWKLTKPRGYLLCHCRQHRHGFQFCCASLFRNLSFFLKERKCSSCHKAIQPLCLSPTPPQVDSDGLQIIRMSL